MTLKLGAFRQWSLLGGGFAIWSNLSDFGVQIAGLHR